ncbi:MAG: phage tail tape measure protein, partial [Sarcina sp.]
MGKDVERLELELALESNNFNKQMTAINKQIKKSEQDFKRAGTGVEGFEKTFVGLDTKIKKTSTQLELYSQKLEKQKSKYKELESTVERQKSKLNELENTLGKGSDEWKKQAQLVQQNSSKLVKLGTDIGKTENSINALESELKQSQSEFENLGKKTKTVAEQLAKVDEEAALAESEFENLGSELNSTTQSSAKFKNEMAQLESKINSSKSKITIYESAIEKLSTELTQSKSAHSQLGNEISQTESKLAQAQNEFGQNSTEAQKLRAKLLELKDSYNSLETEIEQNQSELNQYQTELNQTQTEVNQLSTQLRQMPFDEVGSKMQKLGQGTKEVGQALTAGVTVPIAAAGTAATIAGTNFDTSMSKLQATSGIADKTGDSYVKLKKKALEMGSSTSFSASEAADGLTYLALAGWDVETQITRIEPVLRAAEAGGMDLAVASDKITDSMSSAGVASEDFAKYLDIVAQAQRKSNTSMEQMLDAYVVAGGIFNSLNIQLEESGALLGILANRGTKGSEAGNSLISVFSNLITEAGQAGKALSSLDISLYDTTGKQKNMVKVLKEMAKKLGVAKDGTSSLTEQQKQQYAAMVGGKTQFDTLMKLLNGVSDEYDELEGHLKNSNGALNEMAFIMKDNLGGQMESMKSAIEGALIKAFESMLPILESVVGAITDVANWFSSLDEQQQKNIVTIAAVVACIGPLLMAIGQLIIIGGNAVTLFGGLTAATTATATATGIATTATVGLSTVLLPIVGIIAGVVSVIGGLNWATKKYTEHLENNAINSIDHYVNKLGGISPAASEAGQKIADLEKNTSDIIVDVILGQNLEQRVPEVKAILEEVVTTKNTTLDEMAKKDIEYFDFMISITEGAEKKKYEELKQGATNSINARKEGTGEEIKVMQEHWDKVLKGEEAYTQQDIQMLLNANEQKINAEIENNAELQTAIANGDKNIEELRTRARAESVANVVQALTQERQVKLDALEQEKVDRLAQIEADNTLNAETKAQRLQQVTDMFNEKMQLTRDNNALELAALQEQYGQELSLFSLKNGEMLTAKQQNDATLMEMTRLNNEAELSGLDLHYTRRGNTIESMTTAEKTAIETSNASIKASYDAEFKASALSLSDFERKNGTVTSRIQENEKKIKTANTSLKNNYAEAFKASGMSLGAFEKKYGTLDNAIKNNKNFALDANGKVKASTTKEYDASIKKLKEMGFAYDATTGNITDGSGKIIASNVDATKAADELSKKDADVKKLGKAFLDTGSNAETGNAKTGSTADTAATKVDKLAKKYSDFAKKPNITKSITVNETTNKTTKYKTIGSPEKQSLVQEMSNKLATLSTLQDINIPQLDMSNYQVRGGYYSRESNVSTTMINNLNADIRRLEKSLKNDKESNINVNINLEKVEIKNNDSYEE